MTQVDANGTGLFAPSINEWSAIIYQWAQEKGWWEEPDRNFGELMMLCVTELAEAFEEYRNHHAPNEIYYLTDKYGYQKPEGIPIELADVFVRIMDLSKHYGIDLDEALRIKHAYNKTRPYRHGNKKS